MNIVLKRQWNVPKLRERIIAAHNASDLSVKDIVYQAGLCVSAEWYEIIYGGTPVSWEKVARICQLLNIDIEDIKCKAIDLYNF